MTHRITGIVGHIDPLADLAVSHALACPAPLRHGWAFLALDDTDMEVLFPETLQFIGVDFDYLSYQLINFLAINSAATPLAYIETEYFGGYGTQGAVAFLNGKQVQAPMVGETAINLALKAIGIQSPISGDRFDSIGLGLYRNNDRAKEAGQQTHPRETFGNTDP